jgi:hypothetical protein
MAMFYVLAIDTAVDVESSYLMRNRRLLLGLSPAGAASATID